MPINHPTARTFDLACGACRKPLDAQGHNHYVASGPEKGWYHHACMTSGGPGGTADPESYVRKHAPWMPEPETAPAWKRMAVDRHATRLEAALADLDPAERVRAVDRIRARLSELIVT